VREIEIFATGYFASFSTQSVDSSRPECAISCRSGSKLRTRPFDPERAFKIGSMNGWKAGESGLRLKGSVAR
jgi:hypothetical protein